VIIFLSKIGRYAEMAQRESEKPKKVRISSKQQQVYERLKGSKIWQKWGTSQDVNLRSER